MWTYVEAANLGFDFGTWHCQFVLAHGDEQQSFYHVFGPDEQPTDEQVAAAGARLALRKNLEEAQSGYGSMSREDFLNRFTNSEIAAIYRAAAASDDLFAYIKKMELNPTVNRGNPDVVAGLQMLEAAGLLAAGRAAEILA